MIHNILVYTQEGKILYSWEQKTNSLSFTNKILIPGFFSAINSIIKDIFQGRIQRIEFSDKTIVLSGKEVISEGNSQWILISITVDSIDNSLLVDKLTLDIMQLIISRIDQKYERLNQNQILDLELEAFIRSKTYIRTPKKIMISSIMVLFSISLTILVYSFIRSYKSTIDSSNILSFVAVMIIGGITLTFSAGLAGSKVNSTIIGVTICFIGSIVSFYFIENLGNFFVLITFCSLLGCIFGFVGGMIMDNKYLN